MNKMYGIAKIASALLGIYLLIFTAVSLLQVIIFMFGGRENIAYLALVLLSLLMTLAFAGGVFYFLIYRSDIFARKVVGEGEELPEPPSPAAWYPFALRLAVMIAGFLFLQKAIILSSSLANCARYSFRCDTLAGMWQVCEYGIYFLLYLAISIYLFCGAPQFVRWQMKKTAKFCREFS